MSERDVNPMTESQSLSGCGSTDGISHWLIHHAAGHGRDPGTIAPRRKMVSP
jgi:hypothetical protein